MAHCLVTGTTAARLSGDYRWLPCSFPYGSTSYSFSLPDLKASVLLQDSAVVLVFTGESCRTGMGKRYVPDNQMAFFVHSSSTADERYEQLTRVPDGWDPAAWYSLACSQYSHLLGDYCILGVDPFPYNIVSPSRPPCEQGAVPEMLSPLTKAADLICQDSNPGLSDSKLKLFMLYFV